MAPSPGIGAFPRTAVQNGQDAARNVRCRVHCQPSRGGCEDEARRRPAWLDHPPAASEKGSRCSTFSTGTRSASFCRTKDIDAWGVASNEPRLPLAPDYPLAISMLMRLDPLVVRGLRHGPTEDYAGGVPAPQRRARRRHADARRRAARSTATPPSASPRRTAATERRPPFPHKTAATRAGLGWIGKTALFVSPEFGPAVRLATVFTDLELPGRRAGHREPLRRVPGVRRRLPGRLRARRAVARRHGPRAALRRRRLPSPDDPLRGTSTRRSAASASPPARTTRQH